MNGVWGMVSWCVRLEINSWELNDKEERRGGEEGGIWISLL